MTSNHRPSIKDLERGKNDEEIEAVAGSTELLPRVYNVWTASAYQVLMMASWTCNIVLYGTVFDIGGPMMLVYGTVIVTFCQCLVMSSLAEMCSIWPFAGGQQAFTKALAPARFRRFLSYLTGWIVLLGEVATAAGCMMNNAQIIGAIAHLFHAEFIMTRWLTWLVYTGMILLTVALCFSQKHLAPIAVIDATFVFNTLLDSSGYDNAGWVGLMSLYSPLYGLYGTDGILHLTEEMQSPEESAPKAMIISMVLSGVTSFLGALVMAFCAGNWQVYMDSDIPFIPWFVDVLNGKIGGSVLAVLVIVVLNFLITVSINTAASRLAWGMARDHALPWPKFFMQINRATHSPLNTIGLITLAEIVIGVVAFGSDYAFQAIVSVGGVSIQFGYLIPVLMLLLSGRETLPSPRAFNLGRLGLAINIGSACWSALMIIILFCPLHVPVTSGSIYQMNWAIIIFGGAVGLVSADWMFRGRLQYKVDGE